MKTPALAACNSHYCTCLGHLGQCDPNRNDPICAASPKVAKASTVVDCHVSLLPKVSLTNVANVNDPIGMAFLLSEAISIENLSSPLISIASRSNECFFVDTGLNHLIETKRV